MFKKRIFVNFVKKEIFDRLFREFFFTRNSRRIIFREFREKNFSLKWIFPYKIANEVSGVTKKELWSFQNRIMENKYSPLKTYKHMLKFIYNNLFSWMLTRNQYLLHETTYKRTLLLEVIALNYMNQCFNIYLLLLKNMKHLYSLCF